MTETEQTAAMELPAEYAPKPFAMPAVVGVTTSEPTLQTQGGMFLSATTVNDARKSVSCRVDAKTYAALEACRDRQQRVLQEAGIVREATLADAAASAIRRGLIAFSLLSED